MKKKYYPHTYTVASSMQLLTSTNLTSMNSKTDELINKFDNSSKVGFIMYVNTENNDFVPLEGDIVGNPKIDLNSDGSLDKMLVSINYNDSMGTAKKDHLLDNMTKVITIINASQINNRVCFYLNNYKPMNHLQWIIASGQMAVKGYQKQYCHGYSLVEPIAITQYAYTGTHSNTNLTEVNIQYASTGENYNLIKPKTNLLSILQRELSITGYKTSKEDTTWTNKIKIMDADLLKANGVGTNENFTSATLYDVLTKIGQYINRIPKLYFNPNYVKDSTTDGEQEYLLYFEEKISSVYSCNLTDLTTDSSSINEVNSESGNANKVVCEVSNLMTTGGVWFPGAGKYILGTDSDDKFSVTNDSSVTLKLPHAIKEVIKIVVRQEQYDYSAVTGGNADITRKSKIIYANCLEYKNWLALDATQRALYFYYTDGSNEINIPKKYKDIDTSFGLSSSVKNMFFYSINYIPMSNAKVSSGNGNIEEVINQSDSSLDSENFGNYINNYAKGNISKQLIISKVSDDANIYMPSVVVKDTTNNINYVINKVTIEEFNNNVYDIQYTLSIKSNKRSDYVDDSSRKEYHSVDISKSFDRKDEIIDKTIKVRINTDLTSDTLTTYYLNDCRSMLMNFVTTYKTSSSIRTPQSAFTQIQYENRTRNISGSTTLYNPGIRNILFETSRSVFGKSVLLNMSSKDCMNMQTSGGKIKDIAITGITASNNQIYTRYADDFGCVNKIDIYFSCESIKSVEDERDNTYTSGNNIDDYPMSEVANIISSTKIYPKYSIVNTIFSESPISIINYEINKDTYESLNISYRLPFEEYDQDTFITSKFINELSLVDVKPTNTTYKLILLNTATELQEGQCLPSTTSGVRDITFETTYKTNVIGIRVSLSDAISSGKYKACLCKVNDDGNYDILVCSLINNIYGSKTLLYLEFTN